VCVCTKSGQTLILEKQQQQQENQEAYYFMQDWIYRTSILRKMGHEGFFVSIGPSRQFVADQTNLIKQLFKKYIPESPPPQPMIVNPSDASIGLTMAPPTSSSSSSSSSSSEPEAGSPPASAASAPPPTSAPQPSATLSSQHSLTQKRLKEMRSIQLRIALSKHFHPLTIERQMANIIYADYRFSPSFYE